MKCENCEAMQNTSYEYQEWECVLGIEECEFKDGSFGCTYKAKTIKKMLEDLYEAKAKEWEGFVEFCEEQDKKDNALLKAINEVLFQNSNCLCWKDKNDELHEFNTKEFLKHHIWEIRSKYEEILEGSADNEL